MRRLEIFSDSGQRREWQPDEKARIVAESYKADETVSMVARRYALSPQQLFAWRRAIRQALVAPEVLFVPVVMTGLPSEPAQLRTARPRKRKALRDADVIELEIEGVAMRVGRGVNAKTVAAVIYALKAAS